MSEDRETSASVDLVQGGAELAGAVGGAAIGLLGGPAGAMGGAAAGVLATRALKRVGYEIHERLLAPRQRTRAGAAYAFALSEVHARIETGEEVRDDGFFDGERSSGEELLEGVLLQAADAYEERKLPHLGSLYASFVFDAIEPAYAHYLLRLSELLTYRQYVLIALVGRAFDTQMYFDDPRPSPGVVDHGATTGAEFLNLGANGLIAVEASTGSLSVPEPIWDGAVVEAFRLRRLRLTVPGRDLYKRLGLARVPYDELMNAVDALGYDIIG